MRMASPQASSSTAAHAIETLAIGKPLAAEYATICEYPPILKNPLIKNRTLIRIRPANGVKLFEESLIFPLLFLVPSGFTPDRKAELPMVLLRPRVLRTLSKRLHHRLLLVLFRSEPPSRVKLASMRNVLLSTRVWPARLRSVERCKDSHLGEY